MKTLYILGLGLLTSLPVAGQGRSSSFVTGMTVVGGDGSSCPPFVTYVGAGSPAEIAGIKSGDVLIALEGTSVSTHPEALKLLRSETPKPVTLSLIRREKPYVVTVISVTKGPADVSHYRVSRWNGLVQGQLGISLTSLFIELIKANE